MRFWNTFSKMKTVHASASVLGLIDHNRRILENFLPLVCLMWSGLLGRVRRAPNEEKKKKKDKKKNKEPKDPSATKKPKSDKKGKKKDKQTTTTLPPTTTTTTLPPTTTRESSWELACISTWTALTHECCWPCVCLLPPAIPTEPPTEPYTDYPYADVGEWHTPGPRRSYDILFVFPHL